MLAKCVGNDNDNDNEDDNDDERIKLRMCWSCMYIAHTHTYIIINGCMFALLLLFDSTRLACIFYNKWNVCQQCLTFAPCHAHWPELLYTFTPQQQMCNVCVCVYFRLRPRLLLLAFWPCFIQIERCTKATDSAAAVCVCVCWATVNIYVKLLLYTSGSHRKCQLDNDYSFSQSRGKEGRKEGHALDSQLHKRRID